MQHLAEVKLPVTYQGDAGRVALSDLAQDGVELKGRKEREKEGFH